MAQLLLIEDDAHMIRVLSMWLTRNGHEVVEVGDGMSGQEAIEERSFDLVVSDVNMPRMNGIQFVEWLRVEKKSNVPVIMLSSRSDQANIDERLGELGINIYPKPFSPSRLVEAIETRLEEAATVKGDSALGG